MFGSVVKNYENEFDTKVMENRHVFYDLYVKSNDPQALRNEIAESLGDMDYKLLLNEMTKFDDENLEEVFRGGNAKPIRVAMKAAKDNKKGSKYPILWKAFLILGVILLAVLLVYARGEIYNNISTFSTTPSALLLYGTIASFVLFVLFLEIKYIVPIFLWSKIVGIYDPTSSSANVRIVLAGECQFKDKDSYARLESDMNEIYSELSRKFANKLDKTQLSSNVETGLSIGRGQNQKLTNELRDIENQLSDLERNFAAGKVSESSYKDLKAKLEMKRTQLETLFDLLLP
ncbi:hypothetical protein IG206_02520 [Candidatus Parvarchaeota archaeon]|jgi:hypothetical protein|nr:hypothetical protein [Candidatus Acidifodinimicrobium mancum]